MGAAILVLGLLAGLAASDYLRRLLIAGCPAMSPGLLLYILYRRDHFTSRVGHSTPATHPKVV
jgi:hypothetical protein